MINSIEIKTSLWNDHKDKYQTTYQTITRDEFSGDFDEFILNEMKYSDIIEYARENLQLIKEYECPTRDVDQYSSDKLIDEIKARGYEVILCKTLNDTLEIQKVKELMEFS